MRIKFWLSSIIENFRKQFQFKRSRRSRRRLKSRMAKVARTSVAALAVAATVPLFGDTANGQCNVPLFPVASFDVGGSAVSIVTADFNGDGLIDVVTANSFSNNVSVLLGAGNTKFAGHQTFAAGDVPRSITCLLYTSPSPRD